MTHQRQRTDLGLTMQKKGGSEVITSCEEGKKRKLNTYKNEGTLSSRLDSPVKNHKRNNRTQIRKIVTKINK